MGTVLASESRSKHESIPVIVPAAGDSFVKADALPLMSLLDKCDVFDMEEPVDLLDCTRDMAGATVGTGAAVLEVVHEVSVACGWSSLDPLGVVWPDVKMYSSASPDEEGSLSAKSGKLCGPSPVVAHDDPLSRSADGSVCAKENIPGVLGAMEGWG